MVRHHIKKATKNKKAKKKLEEERQKKNEEPDLDRFAGSSEEEEDDADENNDSDTEEKLQQQKPPKPIDSDDTDLEEAPPAANSSSDDDTPPSSSDEDEYDGPTTTTTITNRKIIPTAPQGPVGMAGAMNRILGLPPSQKHASSVVLSKTTTPLQRLRNKEQRETQEFRARRREKRALNLSAMHVPLAGAGEGVGRELAMERIHRKVATRGVVALFNAISEHQREKARRAAEAGILGSSSSSSKHNKNNPEDVRAMTKHGFLDMLQKKGNATNDSSGEYVTVTDSKDERQPTTTADDGIKGKKQGKAVKKKISSHGWNALKDDFMMNSKLKDWDKQLSEEESLDEVDSSGGEEQDLKRKKGGGGMKDLDDVMEGDISSSGSSSEEE